MGDPAKKASPQLSAHLYSEQCWFWISPMFLSLNPRLSKSPLAKSERSGRKLPSLYCHPILEVLESRLAPAGLLTLPTSGYAGDVMHPVMSYPINVTSLNDGIHTGLASVTLAITFPTGVFSIPAGNSQATADVSLGSIPLADTAGQGGAKDWNLAANSTTDGNLLISLSAKSGDSFNTTMGGSLVTINLPVLLNPSAPTPEAVSVVTSVATTHTSLVGTNGTYTPSALGLPAVGSVTINPATAQPPIVTTPQSYATNSNTAVNEAAPGLLVGAKDPQNQPLAVNAINGALYTPGTPLTLPSGATLTVNSDGSFAYVPAPNFVGSDSFQFTITDTVGAVSSPGTVTITMIPTLSLVPVGSASGSAGDTITEDVVLDNPNPASGVGPLSGFNVAITYDPKELSTASDGSQLALGPDIPRDWTFTPNASIRGLVAMGAFASGGGSDLVTGPAPFVLATVQFTIVGTSTTTTNVELTSAADTPSGAPVATAVNGGNGTFILQPALPGQIKTLQLINGGSGYDRPPEVDFFVGPNSLGPGKATAVLLHNGSDPGGDPVIALVLTDQGDHYGDLYIAPPQVVITAADPNGSGATATATVTPPGTFLPGIDTQVNVMGPAPSPLTFSPGGLPDGDVSTAYLQTISATGGTGPYSFAVTHGALPPGLTLTGDGVLSGMPTQAGGFGFTITATDSSNPAVTGQQAYGFYVNPALSLAPLTLPNTEVGLSVEQQFQATGGVGSYTYRVTTGSVPPGLTLSSSTGFLFGNPKMAGSFMFTVTASDTLGGSARQTCNLFVYPAVTVTDSGPFNRDVGTFYDETFQPSGGTGLYKLSVSGNVPAGVNFSSTSTYSSSPGVLSGILTVARNYSFALTISDTLGGGGTSTYSGTINPPLSISNVTLGIADVGVPYQEAIAVTGGDKLYTFTTTSGTLPAGLSLSAGGYLTGTASAPGSFTFTVTITDGSGGSLSRRFTLNVFNPLTSPVYVDSRFTGPDGIDPATDPGLHLVLGGNAFSTITAGLAHVSSGGTLVIFGGAYTEPSVNFNVMLNAVNIATNPSDTPLSPTVTISGPVTITDSETFDLTGVPTGTGTSTAANLTLNSTESGPGTMTIEGNAGVTFGGAVSGAVVLNGGTLNPTAALTLAGSGSLTMGFGISETTGALVSTSSSTDVQININSSLTTNGAGSSSYAGALTGFGALNKAGPATSLTLTGTSLNGGPTVNVVGTLVVNGSYAMLVVLTDASSVLEGHGSVRGPVVVAGTPASGAIVTSSGGTLTITSGGPFGIDVQPGANNVSISNITVTGSNIGIRLEPGNGNMTSVKGNAIDANNIGVEPLNGCLTVTGNLINGDNTGVEIPAVNPNNPSLAVDPLLTLEGNDLSGNHAFGLENATSMGVTAILNWWGSSSGSAVAAQVSGVSVGNYTPFALDAASVGPIPTMFDFFNGTGIDGNVYVTGTLGQDSISATADTTNNLLVSVTVNGVTNNYLRGNTGNRVIIYGFGDNGLGTRDTIIANDNTASVWNAQINSEALTYREPITFSGTSSSTITTTGFGSDVLLGGGNDYLAALTSGNNVIVAGRSAGRTGAPSAPRLIGGSGNNINIAGNVDCTLAPMASTGRLDYEALSAIDQLWAMGLGGVADAMSVAALFSVVNTPGAILSGTARATIIPGSGQSWFIVKGAGNPVNTPTGNNSDYIAGPTANPNYRQAVQ
jgi:Bacterial Ig domain/Putative Ig domain